MEHRIIKDIRHYELKPDDFVGNFNGMLGNIYKSSFEIKCIGQRIARKLNELNFITGDFDHLYIFLTPKLENGVIMERDFIYDKRVKCFDFGQDRDEYNCMNEIEREEVVTAITFKILKYKLGQEISNKTLIEYVENKIKIEGREIVINYISKESSSYRLKIGFQIAPTDSISKIVIDYLVKSNRQNFRSTIDLHHYEDIYYLVDKIHFDGQQLILYPKRTVRGELVAQNYKTPFNLKVSEFQSIT